MEKIMNILPDEPNTSKDTLWTYKDNIEVFNKYNQYVIIQDKKEINVNANDKKTGKTKIESPLDLIIRVTTVNKIMKNDIKEKLIEFVSLPEFSKAFGLKKSSEIMNGLTKDSWNQSTSLFISFLLDKNIIYKEKSYIFNKEKTNQIITVC